MNWLKEHFERYKQRSPWDFCWRIAVEGTVLGLLAAAILTLIIGEAEREFLQLPMGAIFLVGVLIAPPLETLLLQALPVFVARKLKASFRVQVIVSTVIFAACHIMEGFTTAISAGLVGGFYFGFTYVHWRQKSRWTGFWVTALSHAIHNGIGVGLLAVLGDL
ncbi:MAG TPA: CPBP family glutamic-type intramembrane protease [Sedimentisphaerales bacterium]|nr:CPBP family glutamic-type intramembrane protease [Sedimentisphaerales bacterium]